MILIGMRHKAGHLSFLSKRLNDKIIFTTMISVAAGLFGQKPGPLIAKICV